VKSVSSSLAAPSLPAQEHELALLFPQAQVSPLGLAFSLDEREHVQAPAARWSGNGMLALFPWLEANFGRVFLLHEHLAPVVLFSVDAFSQVQWRAGCLPQEQVASCCAYLVSI